MVEYLTLNQGVPVFKSGWADQKENALFAYSPYKNFFHGKEATTICRRFFFCYKSLERITLSRYSFAIASLISS